MNKKVFFKALLVIGLMFVSCSKQTKDNINVEEVIDTIKISFAPDKRTALFNVKATKNASTYILEGESNLPSAVDSLKTILKTRNIDFKDEIRLLPAAKLGDRVQGVINISVANLRSNPKHSAELATQATLGTPVKVLKQEGSWFLIQTPDRYLSWVDEGGIQLMDEISYEDWKKTNKIIYTKTYGHAFKSEEGINRTSDLVAGAIMELVSGDGDYFKVRFPDGRIAFVLKEEAQDYMDWLVALEPNAEALVETSKTLMGVPYLWGGTSTKGVDCSGFTKTIYFLNGVVIPRDASQQVHTGQSIDSISNFDNLQKGDLLFFGRKANDSLPEKVVHVGMWIGDNQFIHSSNMVRISSIDKNDENYDEYNLGRYLRTKRIINEKDDNLITLNQSTLFKD